MLCFIHYQQQKVSEMAQSVPVPHNLTFVTVKDGVRKSWGPFRYESRGEAVRAKRTARETHGSEFCCAYIDPVQAK